MLYFNPKETIWGLGAAVGAEMAWVTYLCYTGGFTTVQTIVCAILLIGALFILRKEYKKLP